MTGTACRSSFCTVIAALCVRNKCCCAEAWIDCTSGPSPEHDHSKGYCRTNCRNSMNSKHQNHSCWSCECRCTLSGQHAVGTVCHWRSALTANSTAWLLRSESSMTRTHGWTVDCTLAAWAACSRAMVKGACQRVRCALSTLLYSNGDTLYIWCCVRHCHKSGLITAADVLLNSGVTWWLFLLMKVMRRHGHASCTVLLQKLDDCPKCLKVVTRCN